MKTPEIPSEAQIQPDQPANVIEVNFPKHRPGTREAEARIRRDENTQIINALELNDHKHQPDKPKIAEPQDMNKNIFPLPPKTLRSFRNNELLQRLDIPVTPTQLNAGEVIKLFPK